MGFILLAKGEGKIFFWSELIANGLGVGLVWACVLGFGLAGTGIAFFAQYVLYWILIYGIARRVSGFRWSASNKRTGLILALLLAGVFVGWFFLPHNATAALGLTAAAAAGVYSLKTLCAVVSLRRLPAFVQRVIVFLRLAPASSKV